MTSSEQFLPKEMEDKVTKVLTKWKAMQNLRTKCQVIRYIKTPESTRVMDLDRTVEPRAKNLWKEVDIKSKWRNRVSLEWN